MKTPKAQTRLDVALLIAWGVFFLAVLASKSLSHEAPTGWTYPYACCSSNDCRQVTSGPTGLVREDGAGYRIASTGELIAQSDPRVRHSPDGLYHWCSVAGADDTRTICLFVPPPSF
ncbi:hypothetical protein PVE73_04700 [Chelativorans sp. AA-79]|nr:hypothetical protein [Chelativorans sp. AA-79]WEX11802.1 hypothetical protein PVE73_04700 [Chelativorans sp. AA-79]